MKYSIGDSILIRDKHENIYLEINMGVKIFQILVRNLDLFH